MWHNEACTAYLSLAYKYPYQAPERLAAGLGFIKPESFLHHARAKLSSIVPYIHIDRQRLIAGGLPCYVLVTKRITCNQHMR